MKRLLALILVFSLVCMPALAENTGAFSYTVPDTLYTVTWYRHPQDGYSIQCPDGWAVVDSSNIDVLQTETASVSHPLFSIHAALENNAAVIHSNNVLLLVDPQSGTNINILSTEYGVTLDADTILENLVPFLLDQLSSQYAGAEMVDKGSKVTLGSNDFASLSMLYSQRYLSQYYIMHNQKVYVITFTILQDDLENNMESMDVLLSGVLSSMTFND